MQSLRAGTTIGNRYELCVLRCSMRAIRTDNERFASPVAPDAGSRRSYSRAGWFYDLSSFSGDEKEWLRVTLLGTS